MENITPFAAPIPLDDDLSCFTRCMFARQTFHHAAWLRLKRRDRVAALALVELHAACQPERGCGLEDDDVVLAHAAGLDPEEWDAHGAVIREHLVKFESGLLHVRMFLPDTVASYEIKMKRAQRTEAARAARAAKRAAGKAAPADKPAPSPEPLAAAPPAEGPGDATEAATNPSVGLVSSSPVPSPAQRAGTGLEGGLGETDAWVLHTEAWKRAMQCHANGLSRGIILTMLAREEPVRVVFDRWWEAQQTAGAPVTPPATQPAATREPSRQERKAARRKAAEPAEVLCKDDPNQILLPLHRPLTDAEEQAVADRNRERGLAALRGEA